jgi:hypothetical protein
MGAAAIHPRSPNFSTWGVSNLYNKLRELQVINVKKANTSPRARRRAANPAAATEDFPDFGSGEEFDALSDADKERVDKFYEEGHHLSEMRPLTAAERLELKRDRAGIKRGGRPKLGKHGVKVISLSVELELLNRADAYAKKHGLKRAELVTKALKKLLPAR